MIERLPSTSKTWARLANDDEYAEMVSEASMQRAARGESDKGASQWKPEDWTPQMQVLSDLVYEVRHLQSITRTVFGGAWRDPVPYDRLSTKVMSAVKRGDFARRQARHERLVKKLLPHRED